LLPEFGQTCRQKRGYVTALLAVSIVLVLIVPCLRSVAA
jgi:hypothetical protein